MTKLELALIKATEWYYGQVDKAGAPYILHAIQVMLRVRNEEFDEDVQVAALLHDVIEMSGGGIDKYSIEPFGERVVSMVITLTRFMYQTYDEYIDAVCKNEDATAIKICDIEENLRRDRGYDLPESMRKRYSKARAKLLVVYLGESAEERPSA